MTDLDQDDSGIKYLPYIIIGSVVLFCGGAVTLSYLIAKLLNFI